MFRISFTVLLAATATFAPYSSAQNPSVQTKVSPEKEAAIKADLAGEIDHMQKQAQVMSIASSASESSDFRNSKPPNT